MNREPANSCIMNLPHANNWKTLCNLASFRNRSVNQFYTNYPDAPTCVYTYMQRPTTTITTKIKVINSMFF